MSDYLRRRRRARIPNPAITIIAALAGSGTLDVGKDNPLATAKASKAATSPADAPPLTPWLKFAARSEKLAPFARAEGR
ncbi:MAG: hypothetical protein ABSD28_13525 [Tepidisphaeraceae bacterium]|jgi:hypothetical protein